GLAWLTKHIDPKDSFSFEFRRTPQSINDPKAPGILAIPEGLEGKYRALIEKANNIKPEEAAKPGLLKYAAQRRWETETRGVSVLGLSIDTSDRGKVMLFNASLKAHNDQNFTTVWVDKNHKSKELSADDVKQVSDAVSTFVAKV